VGIRRGAVYYQKSADYGCGFLGRLNIGVGVTESSRLGDMNKVSQSVNGDTWELKLPTFILATNFWAEATDLKGQKIKSTDLGSVGYEE
jgi:hypothetical protein